MTLFDAAVPEDSLFEAAFEKFFGGEHVARTTSLLRQTKNGPRICLRAAERERIALTGALVESDESVDAILCDVVSTGIFGNFFGDLVAIER